MKDITYIHEHMTIDLSGVKNNIDCKLNDFEKTKKELLRLKELGVTRIVDVTNMGMGRNVEFITRLEKETGIEILMSTGYYKEPFFPKEVEKLSIEKLEEKLINDIKIGIDGTNKKATFIGEIGTGFEKMTSLEEKVFIVASRVQKKTGVYISTHTSLGKLGHEQLDIIEKNGGNLEKVILGHTDLSKDIHYIETLLKRGVYISFDTIGKINYLSEEKRIEYIKYLCDRGWENKILLSVDLTRQSHLKENGGIGYSYLLEEFVPKLLENGVELEKIEKFLVENPKKILGIK
ncbi:phosphotriesterase family protein [Fusobacterium mortiferum]|jgi:phosphotriesterase-related protein|uniref:Phosphotriesterase-related protein n=1 Tax=Fusobacterium mortiferum ATCC 9817 TaxID=469616 RepID=A0ABM6TT30_FUSMR|nr:TatD family hydrolase [Fusobacterium mortiferum]AVQ17823.1 phosphotriesterase-related protein [Fusobacterium mortiferum ATCC 9817]EEO36482.1 phosphotriesterase family protein [Fusobacterium mortiferum ATCC 9817]MCF2626943.1 TatD family hydrolase [Fusobacterium mortiferum]RGM99891.1 phosphotriesterase-related protein [Fusobacterium mortiferum]